MNLLFLWRPLAWAAAVLAIWGCHKDTSDDHDDMTTGVVSCEEAIGHLEKCCPGFIATRDGQCIDEDYEHKGGGCVYDDYDSLRKIRRLPR